MNDIDIILDKIRDNCSILASYHRKRYLSLKSKLKFYRIPIITLSALNSIAAVSFQNFIEQKYISLINMFFSLLVGIIGSIEMFYQISTQMEVELVGSKDFYVLSIDIFKYLSTNHQKREINENTFLSDVWARYVKLIETSYVLKKKIDDKLAALSMPSTNLQSSTDLFVDTSSEDTP